MAKKDLFELLQVRQRVGRQPRKPEPVRFAGVRSWFESLQGHLRGKKPSARAKSPAKGSSRKVALSGLGLSLLLLGALVVGLLIGRGLTPVKEHQELATHKAEKPDWVPPGDRDGAPDLSADKEVETLSSTFYPVLACLPGPNGSGRDRAGRLALYLREQGLDKARIKLIPLTEPRGGSDHAWATVVYAEQADADATLQRLRSVSPPDFEPGFRRTVDSLDRLKRVQPEAN